MNEVIQRGIKYWGKSNFSLSPSVFQRLVLQTHKTRACLNEKGLRRVQLKSILIFADHITFYNGYMKHSHTRQRITNNNNNYEKKNKFDTSDNPGLLSYAITVTLKFKLNSIKCLDPF